MPFFDTPELREFLDARGIKWTVEGMRLEATVPHVCPHLVGDVCGIHDLLKPAACKEFRCVAEVNDASGA